MSNIKSIAVFSVAALALGACATGPAGTQTTSIAQLNASEVVQCQSLADSRGDCMSARDEDRLDRARGDFGRNISMGGVSPTNPRK